MERVRIKYAPYRTLYHAYDKKSMPFNILRLILMGERLHKIFSDFVLMKILCEGSFRFRVKISKSLWRFHCCRKMNCTIYDNWFMPHEHTLTHFVHFCCIKILCQSISWATILNWLFVCDTAFVSSKYTFTYTCIGQIYASFWDKETAK